jgi:hypothetical protein
MGSVLGEEDKEDGPDDDVEGDGESEKRTGILGRAWSIDKLCHLMTTAYGDR